MSNSSTLRVYVSGQRFGLWEDPDRPFAARRATSPRTTSAGTGSCCSTPAVPPRARPTRMYHWSNCVQTMPTKKMTKPARSLM